MGRLCKTSTTNTATALLSIFVLVIAQRVHSYPSGFFELDLVSLANADGQRHSGGCCSGVGHPLAGTCSGNCSVSLHFCITHYQRRVDPHTPCTFFEFETPLFYKEPHRGASPSPLYGLGVEEMTAFNLTYSWPGEFSLIVEALHPSEKAGEGKILVERFVAQRTLAVGPEWKTDTLTTKRSLLRIRYRVVCSSNYYGAKCEIFCRARNDTFGHYSCTKQGEKVCLPGWGNASDYCRLALCEPECGDHGWCSDEPNKCKCKKGWKGSTCEICETHPSCQHGRCETQPMQCLCDEGWGGLMCDLDLNYCTNHKPCKNGGTCTNTGLGSYTCSCSEDYMGPNCEIFKNPCMETNPCENGGTCLNGSTGQYSCTCVPGFFGQHCETKAEICKSSSCLNGGTCIHDPNGFKCSCPMGFMGSLCEQVDDANCQIHPCLNSGTCINSSNGFHCLCPHGISGSRCEISNHCSSDSCVNGGTCRERDSTNITCDCPTGFSGTHCQINNNQCSSNPCANGATCYNLVDGFRCDCATGYHGQYCNYLDHCRSSPCLNGASCHATATSYKCRCPKGYRGNRCHLTDTLLRSEHPSVASNVSHRISHEADREENDVVLAVGLSVAFTLFLLVLICTAWCLVKRRRCRQRQMKEPCSKAKDCGLDLEEERLQNDKNDARQNDARQLNNKQCSDMMPRKIVNEFERTPPKLTNEAPPKVLNREAVQKIPDKSLVCSPRTFQKIDNTRGSSLSFHVSQDYPPCHSGSIYVIEDHLRLQLEPGPGSGKDVLATEV